MSTNEIHVEELPELADLPELIELEELQRQYYASLYPDGIIFPQIDSLFRINQDIDKTIEINKD